MKNGFYSLVKHVGVVLTSLLVSVPAFSADFLRLPINNDAGLLKEKLPCSLFDAGGIPLEEVTTFIVTGTWDKRDFDYVQSQARLFAALDTIDLSAANFTPVTIDGVTYPADEIAPNAFNGFRGLGFIRFPNNIRRIREKAFAGCSAMKIMPNSVEIIDQQAFAWSRSLGDAITSSNLKIVNTEAWAYCDDATNEIGLNNLIFPSLVLESFGNSVFANCNLMESVTMLKATPPTVGSFGNGIGKNGKKPFLYVPDASVSAYNAVDEYVRVFDIKPLSTAPQKIFDLIELAK